MCVPETGTHKHMTRHSRRCDTPELETKRPRTGDVTPLFRHRHQNQPASPVTPAPAPAEGGANPPENTDGISPTGLSGRTNVRLMINNNKWNTHITALQNYVTRTGTARVPRNHVEATEFGEVRLGAWVSYVRHRQRKGHLTVEQESTLSSLPNWQWAPFRAGRIGDPERDARIVARARQGERLRALADEFGLTRQRIHQIVKSSR